MSGLKSRGGAEDQRGQWIEGMARYLDEEEGINEGMKKSLLLLYHSCKEHLKKRDAGMSPPPRLNAKIHAPSKTRADPISCERRRQRRVPRP